MKIKHLNCWQIKYTNLQNVLLKLKYLDLYVFKK